MNLKDYTTEELHAELKRRREKSIVRQMVADGQLAQDVAEKYFPELAESKDEKVRKATYNCVKWFAFDSYFFKDVSQEECLAWLEKQKSVTHKYNVGVTIYYNSFGKIKSMVVANVIDTGDGNPMYEDADGNAVFEKDLILQMHVEEQKLVESEPFEIEHGKYYYCIKDYYSGGNKRASKGDVVQALRGMNMMALDKNANEYFIPVNSIKQKPVEWNSDDEQYLLVCKNALTKYQISDKWDAGIISRWLENRLKSLRPQPKREWTEKDEKERKHCIDFLNHPDMIKATPTVAKNCKEWLKSLKDMVLPKQEWSEEDEDILKWTLNNLTELKDRFGEGYGKVGKCISWIKSLH